MVFRALKLSNLENFRALKDSNLANRIYGPKTLQSGEVMALKASNLATGTIG